MKERWSDCVRILFKLLCERGGIGFSLSLLTWTLVPCWHVARDAARLLLMTKRTVLNHCWSIWRTCFENSL
jgi:hypothetical protein